MAHRAHLVNVLVDCTSGVMHFGSLLVEAERNPQLASARHLTERAGRAARPPRSGAASIGSTARACAEPRPTTVGRLPARSIHVAINGAYAHQTRYDA